MIRVFTQDNWQMGTVDVYAVVRDSDRARGRLLVPVPADGDQPSREAEGWFERELSEESAAFGDVTLRLPVDVVAPLRAALGRTTIPDAGAPDVSDELADCRSVRDRALGMVERIVDADLAREAVRNG